MKDLDYYMALPYRIEIIEDTVEGGFTLHCPDLPGCITCAVTVDDGLIMLEDAKRCWFTSCLEDGIEIPEPTAIDPFCSKTNQAELARRITEFEAGRTEAHIYNCLIEAEREAADSQNRRSHAEVMNAAQNYLKRI